jgi:hypothetical protein
MARMRSLWAPVLVALLVAGFLGLSGGGGTAAAVGPRVTTASIVVPAAAFVPSNKEWSYSNNGNFLRVNSGGLGYGHFLAPLQLPVPVANITRITLYAYDNHPAQVGVSLYRVRPAVAIEKALGAVGTTDSTADPQAPYAAISGGLVSAATQGAYLHLGITGTGVLFYGVKITYTY